jgi:SAM-dependent methyltransferase
MIYDAKFFADQEKGSLNSAAEIVPYVIELVRPRSVVDVGCGTGTWASIFIDSGVEDVMGVDGPYVNPRNLHIPKSRFTPANLEEPIDLGREFDLAVCLEVAEHLPAAAAQTLVESLTNLAPVVLFSAAIPHQGGVHHVNEQWQDYWLRTFSQRGFTAIDCVRARFWDNPNVEYWYAQNMFLYVQGDHLASYPRLASGASDRYPISVVHPQCYLNKPATRLPLLNRVLRRVVPPR